VGMALTAVTDNAHLAPLDDTQVSVIVVKHLNCHSGFPFLDLLFDVC
jgi:hypothetical protein